MFRGFYMFGSCFFNFLTKNVIFFINTGKYSIDITLWFQIKFTKSTKLRKTIIFSIYFAYHECLNLIANRTYLKY